MRVQMPIFLIKYCICLEKNCKKKLSLYKQKIAKKLKLALGGYVCDIA